MKHSRAEHRPVERQRPHVRQIVAHLRAIGATDILVIAPKHYRILFTWHGSRLEIPAATSPRIPSDAIHHAKRALAKLGVR